MLSNRGRDTAPERALRSALHSQGWRFRVNFRPEPSLRRTADIVFTRQHVAVFVDGCFWHGCPIHGSTPTRNSGYWTPKLRRNIERDRDTDARLAQAGWKVVRVWEHEELAGAVTKVVEALQAES